MYEVSPTYGKRKEVVTAMKEFIKDREDWDEYNLDDDTKWSKFLLEFLIDEYHIDAIQRFFIKS